MSDRDYYLLIAESWGGPSGESGIGEEDMLTFSSSYAHRLLVKESCLGKP